jgi:hypothetical protein
MTVLSFKERQDFHDESGKSAKGHQTENDKTVILKLWFFSSASAKLPSQINSAIL